MLIPLGDGEGLKHVEWKEDPGTGAKPDDCWPKKMYILGGITELFRPGFSITWVLV